MIRAVVNQQRSCCKSADFTKLSQLKSTADNFYNLGVSQLVLAAYSEAIASLDRCLKLN
ncbi:MAG: hypothetical protein QNJ72_12625 [Pleurocapsa sp. MO_226.B13]|nr:hypothetical protein [Pleurocapsa sp. MO_226.B13]